MDTRHSLIRTRGDSIGLGIIAAFLLLAVPLSFVYEFARVGLVLMAGALIPYCTLWLVLYLIGSRKRSGLVLLPVGMAGLALMLISDGWMGTEGGYPQSLWRVFGQGLLTGSIIASGVFWNQDARQGRAPREPSLASFAVSFGATLALLFVGLGLCLGL